MVDKKLAAIDITASIMCLEQKMPMLVFGLERREQHREILLNGEILRYKSNRLAENRAIHATTGECFWRLNIMDEKFKKYEDKMKKTL